jgi:hypothetical protein
MKSLIKQLLRENLLLEGQAYPFQETNKTEYGIQYEFIADNIPYIVTLITNEQKELYELGFNVKGAEDFAYRTKKDITHLNNILATIDDIVKKAVYDYRIKKIAFQGAREETDSQAMFLKSLRDKTYLRYLKQHHPNAIIDDNRQGHSFVIMKSIYPEVFEQNKDKKDILIDLLMEISDEYPDEDYFTRVISFNEYTNKIQCDVDGIVNSNLGQARIQIEYDENYDVEIEIYNTNEMVKKEFKTFNQVLAFIKEIFLTPRKKAPQEVPEEEFIGTQALIAVANKLRTMGYDVKAKTANNLQQLIKPYPQEDNTIFLIHMEDEEEYSIYFTANDLNVRVIYDKEEKTYWLNIFENSEQRDDEIVSQYYQSIEELLKDIK